MFGTRADGNGRTGRVLNLYINPPLLALLAERE